jgi:acyl-CoA thioesterase-1
MRVMKSRGRLRAAHSKAAELSASEKQTVRCNSRWIGQPERRAHSPRRGAKRLVGSALLGLWAAKAVRVGRSVFRYADYWAVPRGEAGGLLYVALGDSAAQGVGASRPERGYIGLLAQRMRDQSGRPVQVVNLSRSGARLADLVRDQLPKLAELSPDVVTVDIGGNDVVVYNAERFSALVCILTAALPAGAFVADVPYFMHGRWERRATEAGRVLTDFAADWFHPNDRGHRIWADAFWDRMENDPALAAAPGPKSPSASARRSA